MPIEPPTPRPHNWPPCPWPGWAELYAHLIVDLYAIDPDLVVVEVTTSLGDFTVTVDASTSELRPAVYSRIDDAEDEARATCVVCGALADPPVEPVPTLCEDHVVPGPPG